jgi:hypothetical protein
MKKPFPRWGAAFVGMTIWMVFMNLRPIQAYDFWWHLASGRAIVQSQTIPKTYPFSFTAQGGAWVNSYWLFDWVAYTLFQGLGLGGLIGLKSLMGAIIAILVGFSLPSKRPAPSRFMAVAFFGGDNRTIAVR